MTAWVRRAGGLLCALAVMLATMLLLGVGYGPVAPLGPALVPGAGVWETAGADLTAHDETVRLPGMDRSATVTLTRDGYAAVDAATDRDLFAVQGYVTARFRLAQMDLARRLGRGRLAELVGPAQLESDKFELRLGLLRSARAEWARYPDHSPARRALTAYAEGANARLRELAETGQWPALHALTGVRPDRWTPVDSLLVQKVFTQQMDFTTAPLTHELLRDSLGEDLAAAWLPLRTVTEQQPYDTGPYRTERVERMTAPDANSAAPAPAAPSAPTPAPARTAGTSAGAETPASATTAEAAAGLLNDLRRLPTAGSEDRFNSNAWAVNGPAVAGGGSLLAGDPHIGVSLPSSWFEITLRSPGYRVSGGSLPGVPAVIIGHNEHVAWTLTNASTQGTFYYDERTSPDHPGAYYWNGKWRRTEKVRYTIPVRGADPAPLGVELTVHGPVMTVKGRKLSVSWLGSRTSDHLGALLDVNRAADYGEFRASLRDWRAPAMNFVYADDRGDIAAISPGYYPQFPPGTEPWLPMSGTGWSDATGTIPFDAVPQVHNPLGHVISSTNQRPVGDDYPYYIGTSEYFDPGYRQSVILDRLRADRAVTQADSTALQSDARDELARRLVPVLVKALDAARPDGRQGAARNLLARWDHGMRGGSPAASIWWTFLTEYLSDVFQPWWDAKRVPAKEGMTGLDPVDVPVPLLEALERWTLHDPGNRAFTAPGRPRRDAPAMMRGAFARAVNKLTDRLGPDPSSWRWDRLHSRRIAAVSGAPALGYGPYPDGGNRWTVDAAGGAMTSDFGPSWRMTTHWKGPGRVKATAIYPGGQSENPASPWYTNLVDRWRDRRTLPLAPAWSGIAEATWTVRPGG